MDPTDEHADGDRAPGVDGRPGERHGALARAIRVLGRLWLSELGPEDVAPVLGLPVLGPALQGAIDARDGDVAAALVDVAAEHHRLFGIEVPPYESVFVDPSGMLGAPASQRVAERLRRVGWRASGESGTGARVASPDHIGLELLALGDLIEAGASAAADGLVRDHLALWTPPLALALRDLRPPPHPLYAALGELTLDVVLRRLEEAAGGGEGRPEGDPFPDLPPAPRYASSEDEVGASRGGDGGDRVDGDGDGGWGGDDGDRADGDGGGGWGGGEGEGDGPDARGEGDDGDLTDKADGDGSAGSRDDGDRTDGDGGDRSDEDQGRSERRLARRLCVPREAGMFLSRARIRDAARAAGVPAPGGAGGPGGRAGMLADVLRTAGALDALDALVAELDRALAETGEDYAEIARRHPAWNGYAAAWSRRLEDARATIARRSPDRAAPRRPDGGRDVGGSSAGERGALPYI